jgi:hypothetical protein
VKAVRAKLQGIKTYLVMAAGVLTALAAFADGALDLWGLLAAVLVALGVVTVKAGENRKEAVLKELLGMAMKQGQGWLLGGEDKEP